MGGSFLAGVVAGYAIAIPVGAIAVLIVEQGLRRGFRAGFAAGAGAATADGLYAALAMVAGVAVSAALAPIETPLRLIAGLVLLGIAGRGILSLIRDRSRPSAALDPSTRGWTIYVRFTGLTLLNPQTVIYFAALILGLPQIGADPASRVAFVSGAFLASFSWQTVLALVGAVAHRRLPPGFRTVLGALGSVVIAGFAIAILVGPR